MAISFLRNRVLEMEEVETPNWRATSAKDIPSSITNRLAKAERI
jgi:hypothetical protein